MSATTIQIPRLHRVTLPEHSTIDSLKRGLKMSEVCERALTEVNFGTPKLPGYFRFGFYGMGREYQAEEAESEITMLARMTGRKIRIAAPQEALYGHKSALPLPWGFVAFGKTWNKQVLYFMKECFHIGLKVGAWSSEHKVCVVEEL